MCPKLKTLCSDIFIKVYITQRKKKKLRVLIRNMTFAATDSGQYRLVAVSTSAGVASGTAAAASSAPVVRLSSAAVLAKPVLTAS